MTVPGGDADPVEGPLLPRHPVRVGDALAHEVLVEREVDGLLLLDSCHGFLPCIVARCLSRAEVRCASDGPSALFHRLRGSPCVPCSLAAPASLVVPAGERLGSRAGLCCHRAQARWRNPLHRPGHVVGQLGRHAVPALEVQRPAGRLARLPPGGQRKGSARGGRLSARYACSGPCFPWPLGTSFPSPI
jgi:hypothetical protein